MLFNSLKSELRYCIQFWNGIAIKEIGPRKTLIFDFNGLPWQRPLMNHKEVQIGHTGTNTYHWCKYRENRYGCEQDSLYIKSDKIGFTVKDWGSPYVLPTLIFWRDLAASVLIFPSEHFRHSSAPST